MIENGAVEDRNVDSTSFVPVVAEYQQTIYRQELIIAALQNRIYHLEMEIVDHIAESLMATRVAEPSLMESPE